MIDLGTLGGALSIATGIDDRGEVVGQSEAKARTFLGFRSRGRQLEALKSLNNRISGASAINARGQIAGFSSSNVSPAIGCIWTNGRGKALPLPRGFQFSIAEDLNDNGHAVGYAVDRKGETAKAVLWKDDRARELGTLGGDSSAAFAVSNRGQIAGSSSLTSGRDARWNAALWENGQIRDLGRIQDHEWSGAWDVNLDGDVVGASGIGCSYSKACIWRAEKLYDLNTLIPQDSGWKLFNAAAINDRGQIAGTGTFNGELYGFVLNPRSTRWDAEIRASDVPLSNLQRMSMFLAYTDDSCRGFNCPWRTIPISKIWPSHMMSRWSQSRIPLTLDPP
jgi:probable HAF family extracellular repeat protein